MLSNVTLPTAQWTSILQGLGFGVVEIDWDQQCLLSESDPTATAIAAHSEYYLLTATVKEYLEDGAEQNSELTYLLDEKGWYSQRKGSISLKRDGDTWSRY